MNKPVDFAGRMVFNEQDQEIFNFGKHKGKTVEQVFDTEPSYYAWMKQGDFPLYTKKKLEEIWTRWNKKKEQAKQEKQQQQQAGANKPKPAQPNANPSAPQAKKPKPAVAVTNDMLEQLKMKFGK
ncbi:hypothetical protein D3C86_1435080 [compost metagenome]